MDEFKFTEPKKVTIVAPDGRISKEIDPYTIHGVIVELQAEHGRGIGYIEGLRDWLAEQLSVEPETFNLCNVRDFAKLIIDEVEELDTDGKKKAGMTANSQPPTPESPTTSEDGT